MYEIILVEEPTPFLTKSKFVFPISRHIFSLFINFSHIFLNSSFVEIDQIPPSFCISMASGYL